MVKKFNRVSSWLRTLIMVAIILSTAAPIARAEATKQMDECETALRLEQLHTAWVAEREKISYSSRTLDYINLPSFRKIVAMGRPVLPFLQNKLRQQKDMDYMLAYAVVEICGWNKAEFTGGAGEQGFAAKVLSKMEREFPTARNTDTATAEQLTKTLAIVLRECESIKPGSTRADLLKVFMMEGGLSTRSKRTYMHRLSPYIKVDVEFAVDKSDSQKEQLGTDIISKISKPYLAWPILD